MKLKKLLSKIENGLDKKSLSLNIEKIKIDENKIDHGDLFLLLKDDKLAAERIKKALGRGAAIALAKNCYGIENCFNVSDPRYAFAIMEKRLNKCACDKMKIIGVTGTNGKTTTTNIIYHVLKCSGKKVGIIGSLGYKIDGDWVDTGFTTPDPDILHEIFLKMKREHVEYVVMEVSAHALELKKMDGICFEIGVLTNITQDHLDFFGNMRNYACAKYKLFEGRCKKAVVCADDVSENEFAQFCKCPYISCGIKNPCDVFGAVISESFTGSEFFCCVGGKTLRIQTNLVGEYNIKNTLAAISVCCAMGLDLANIKTAVATMPQVDGRFNIIENRGKIVVIDFAHTPDGLEKVIMTAKRLAQKRVLTLFGCGGNRDAIKRPIMGKISTTLSDKSYFTSDNPRFEDPQSIVDQIVSGAVNNSYVCEPDRKKAIKLILDEAQEGDVVVIAGKGTERYQDICGEKIPYDDYSQVYAYFSKSD